MKELHLRSAQISDDYRKKWNIHMDDFLHLFIGDEQVSDTLYRVGGHNGKKEGEYTMLLKNVEALYDKSIVIATKKKPTTANRRHLESRWCIIDGQGKEVKEFKQFTTSLYLQGGVIYSLNGKLFNILTGEEIIGSSSSTKIHTKDFIIVENLYDKNEEMCGVLKINKADGSVEMLSKEEGKKADYLTVTLADGTLPPKKMSNPAEIFAALVGSSMAGNFDMGAYFGQDIHKKR
jgi:hypothetical protein